MRTAEQGYGTHIREGLLILWVAGVAAVVVVVVVVAEQTIGEKERRGGERLGWNCPILAK